MRIITRALFTIGLIFGTALAARAEVKAAGIFGDHMVLQGEQNIPIWGTAEAGEKVKVSAGDHVGAAVTGADGEWRVELPPFRNDTPALTVRIEGKSNSVTFQDVLIGEVWLSSGQSNMEFCLRGTHNAKEALAEAGDQQLRIFYVNHATALEPQREWKALEQAGPDGDPTGKWLIADPKTVFNFSGVAYFFGRELRHRLQRPVGLIGCSVGGTAAQAWTSISALAKPPPFTRYLEEHENLVAEYPRTSVGYAKRKEGFEQATKEWNAKYDAGVYARETAWAAAAQEARAAGQPIPARPELPVPRPSFPSPPDGGPNKAGNLFNGMIAPLMPYAIKGVIWYQGEFNSGAAEYRTLFPRLIEDWREKWGEGDFPFLFVQLAAFGSDDHIQGGGEWALLQEAQARALALPKTGMVTTTDIGDFVDIHPADKLDVGLRLALVARHVAYGEAIVCSGPAFETMAKEGSGMRISFRHAESGLMVGHAPWTAANALPLRTDRLLGFVIAGADQKYVAADAEIDGRTVLVSSPSVPNPVAVRYNFANYTEANLYNKDGLPAPPFRTDNWENVLSPTLHPTMRAASATAHLDAAPISAGDTRSQSSEHVQ